MSSVSGVTRPSGWAKGFRVPAYTLLAPLLKASSTSALPMPRLAPVTRTALPAIIITVSSSPSCSVTPPLSERLEQSLAHLALRLRFAPCGRVPAYQRPWVLSGKGGSEPERSPSRMALGQLHPARYLSRELGGHSFPARVSMTTVARAI